jgi:ADP-dependent phosphofructokinase/glucokinase
MTGFNANIDRIIRVTPSLLRAFRKQKKFSSILNRLEHAMRYCSADEMVIHDPAAFSEISSYFSNTGSFALGGQAGIAALQMRRLGIASVICAVPGAGSRTRTLLQHADVLPLTFPEAGRQPDRIHLIFEFSPGLVPLAEGVVPRNNRFIVSPAHDPHTVMIPINRQESFLDQIRSCQRAFLSGYQFLEKKEDFITAASQALAVRRVNPLMRIHTECVSGVNSRVISMIIEHILPHMDSIGLNERELGEFTKSFDLGSISGSPSSPVSMVRDALACARATGVQRIHVHTFGYYILILAPGTGEPVSSQNALLFAAQKVAGEAGRGDQVLSHEGLMAYEKLLAAFGPDETLGIFTVGDHIVVFVPSLISQDVKKTTGLGDILSSTAFVADPF